MTRMICMDGSEIEFDPERTIGDPTPLLTIGFALSNRSPDLGTGDEVDIKVAGGELKLCLEKMAILSDLMRTNTIIAILVLINPLKDWNSAL